MVRVTPIKMQAGTKVLWFDPGDIDVKANDHVIVKTERGTEFGTATADIMEVSDELIADLKSPLKPVIRIATEEDVQRADELAQQGEEALVVFKEFAEGASDQMRPVMVEFLFDGDKAVFYFEAEERVDFRDLVRKLAGHFHVRVDMRQIGVRDESKMLGGLVWWVAWAIAAKSSAASVWAESFLLFLSVWQRSRICRSTLRKYRDVAAGSCAACVTSMKPIKRLIPVLLNMAQRLRCLAALPA